MGWEGEGLVCLEVSEPLLMRNSDNVAGCFSALFLALSMPRET